MHRSLRRSPSAQLLRLVALPCALTVGLSSMPVEAARLTYDSANRLARSDDGETTIAYRYDGLGNLVRACKLYANAPSECVDIMVDVTAEYPVIVGEVGPGGSTLYAYGPGGLTAAARDGQVFHALRDQQGTVRGLVDAQGQVAGRVAYEAFGHVRARKGEQISVGYTGEWTSDHNLIYLRARAYAPEIGRFLQRDDFRGDISQPLSLNRYSYAHNNPINLSDPSGNVVPILAIPAAIMLGLIFGTMAAMFTPAAADFYVSRQMDESTREATAELRRQQVSDSTLDAMATHAAVMTVATAVAATTRQPPRGMQTTPTHRVSSGIRPTRTTPPKTVATNRPRTTQPPRPASPPAAKSGSGISRLYERIAKDFNVLRELRPIRTQIKDPTNTTADCVYCAQRTSWALSTGQVLKPGQSAGKPMIPLNQTTVYKDISSPQELAQLALKHLKPWQQGYVIQNTRILKNGEMGGHIFNVYSRPLKPGGRGIPIFVDESGNAQGSIQNVLEGNGYPYTSFELRIIEGNPVIPPSGP